MPWVTTRIDRREARIDVEIAINFLRARKLPEQEFADLKARAKNGIARYWSRAIEYQQNYFDVRVQVVERSRAALRMKIVVNGKKRFARSFSPGLIAARLKYNGMFYANKPRADQAFELTTAHEFGHSVLLASGGLRHSWGHKGTVVSLLQTTRKTAPCYPPSGEIDLMCYYNGIVPDLAACCARTQAAESDLRALIELGMESRP